MCRMRAKQLAWWMQKHLLGCCCVVSFLLDFFTFHFRSPSPFIACVVLWSREWVASTQWCVCTPWSCYTPLDGWMDGWHSNVCENRHDNNLCSAIIIVLAVAFHRRMLGCLSWRAFLFTTPTHHSKWRRPPHIFSIACFWLHFLPGEEEVLLLVIVLWVFLRLDDVYIYTLDCTRVGKKKIEGGDSPSGRIDPSSRSLPPPPIQYNTHVDGSLQLAGGFFPLRKLPLRTHRPCYYYYYYCYYSSFVFVYL
jgi:hypothetical protein